MLYIKPEKLKQISLTSNNFAVLMDFDRTITTKDSMGSWSVFENPKFMNPKFQKETKELVDTYFPYELDYSISEEVKSFYLDEWYYKNMDLLYQYHLTHSILLECIKDSKMQFHKGCTDFLNKLYQRGIPVIIMSAGIGNVITEFLKQNHCLYPNIHIISNFISFKNDTMLPFTDNMIHTSNKSMNRLPLSLQKEVQAKDYILLFGDLIEDLNMAKGQDFSHILSFGFLEQKINENLQLYKDNFDVVLTAPSSFDDICIILNDITHKSE